MTDGKCPTDAPGRYVLLELTDVQPKLTEESSNSKMYCRVLPLILKNTKQYISSDIESRSQSIVDYQMIMVQRIFSQQVFQALYDPFIRCMFRKYRKKIYLPRFVAAQSQEHFNSFLNTDNCFCSESNLLHH